MLQWWEVDWSGTYSVGSLPYGICFDGVNIWVANLLSDNVTCILVT
jgi:hypothetical protein